MTISGQVSCTALRSSQINTLTLFAASTGSGIYHFFLFLFSRLTHVAEYASDATLHDKHPCTAFSQRFRNFMGTAWAQLCDIIGLSQRCQKQTCSVSCANINQNHQIQTQVSQLTNTLHKLLSSSYS